MQNRTISTSLVRTGIAACLTLGISASASAERLVMPDWYAIASGNTGGEYRSAVIRDKVSNGQAVDNNVPFLRRVRVRRGGRLVTRMREVPNVVRPGISRAGADIGNSYFAIPTDEASTTAYAATEIVTLGKGMKSWVDFYMTQGDNWIEGPRMRHMVTNGDVRVLVQFRGNRPLQMLVWQHIPAGWKFSFRARFRPNGCAGHPGRAMACVSDLVNGGPAPTARAGKARNGKRVRVPATDKMVEVGVDLAKFTSRWSPKAINPRSLRVRTTSDVAIGAMPADGS